MAFSSLLKNLGNRVPLLNRTITTDEEKRRMDALARAKAKPNKVVNRLAVEQARPKSAKPRVNVAALATSKVGRAVRQPRLVAAPVRARTLMVGQKPIRNNTSVRPAPSDPSFMQQAAANPVVRFVGRNLATRVSPTYGAELIAGVLDSAGADDIARRLRRDSEAAKLGIARSLVGTGEGISGLYDLATPGKGNNRVGKVVRRGGELADQQVKDKNLNPWVYQGSQVATDVAQFAIPGSAMSRGASEAAKGASLAGRAVRYFARPDVLTDIVTDAAMSTGLRSNRGQDISPSSVATDAGISAAFGGALGAVAYGARKGARYAKDNLPSAARRVKQLVKDVVGKRKLGDDALQVISNTEDENLIKAVIESDAAQAAKGAVDKTTEALVRTKTPRAVRAINPKLSDEAAQVIASTQDPNLIRAVVDSESRGTRRVIRGGESAPARQPVKVTSPTIKTTTKAPVKVPEVAQESVEAAVKELPPAVKKQLEDVARAVGAKNTEELIKLAEPRGVSNIAEATPAPVSSLNLADQLATEAKQSKKLYKKKGIWQRTREAWEPRTAAIDIDKRYAKSQNAKLRDVNKSESVEALLERSEQYKNIAAEYLKDSNIAKVIQKYGRGNEGERNFNTYRLFLRDLERRVDGKPPMFRDIDSQAMANWVSKYEKANPSARGDLAAIVKDIEALQDLTTKSDAAFLSPEDLARARTRGDGSSYNFYTPAQRATPEELSRPGVNVQNAGTLGQQKVLQEMTGSDIPLDPTFDALTDYTETIFKQLGQSRVVKKVAERVKQGVIPDARFIQTGDEAARVKQLRGSFKELGDIKKSLQRELSRVKARARVSKKDVNIAGRQLDLADTKAAAKLRAAEVEAQRASIKATGRAKEILKSNLSPDDVDARAALDSLTDDELMDVLNYATKDELFSKGVPGKGALRIANTAKRRVAEASQVTKTQAAAIERIRQKSAAHSRLLTQVDDMKMDLESVENARKGVGRELVELRPDPVTGKQVINGIDENGNKFKIEIPPKYAEVLQGTNKEQLNAALRALKTAQQPFREAFTGILNPGFQIAQATFNVMMTPIISKAGIRTLGPDAIKAAVQSLTNSGDFQRAILNAGAIKYGGNLQRLASDSIPDALAAQASLMTKAKWNANPLRGWHKLSAVGGKMDAMARTASARAVYQKSVRAGRTADEAMADAVWAYNNTLPNFSNLSSLMKGLDAMVMYTGAGQAGTRTFLRAIKEDPARVGGRLAVVGLGLTGVAAYNMSQDKGEEFYKDMRDSNKQYILDNNIIVVTPGARKDPETGEWTGIWKAPIPPELRPVNRAVQDTIDKNTEGIPVKQYGLALFDTVTGQSRQNNNPLVQTAYGTATGRDPRTGQDIFDETLTPEEKRSQQVKYVGRSLGLAGQVSTGGGVEAIKNNLLGKIRGAKGLSEGARYFKNEEKAIKEVGLNQNELDAYNSVVAPRGKNLAGRDIREKTYYDGIARAAVWSKYPKTFEVSKRMDEEKRAEGKPGDPLFDLNESQQRLVLGLMRESPGNRETDAIIKLNPWIKNYYKKRSDYFDKVKATMKPEDQAKMGIDPRGIRIPTASPSIKAKLELLDGLDKTAKAKFYAENPDVLDFFSKQEDYTRVKRDFMGLPQFDRYPKPSADVQKLLDVYSKLPKDNGPLKRDGTPSSPQRSAWIKAHPKEWEQMTDYFNIKAQYDLAQAGSLAVYEGIGFNEDDYKDISNLARAGDGGGGGGFGFGFGPKAGISAADITNMLGTLSKTALREQPKIKRKPLNIETIPAAAPKNRININSLVLPNRLPSFKVSGKR